MRIGTGVHFVTHSVAALVRRAVPVLVALASLLAVPFASGKESESGPVRLLEPLAKARLAAVWHQRERLEVRKPVKGIACAKIESKRIGDARPGREWVRRFAAALVRDTRVVCEERCGAGWGSVHRFVIRNTGLGRAVVEFVPEEGLAHVRSGDGDEGATFDVSASLPTLLALLREAMPRDTTLARWAADSDSGLYAGIRALDRAPVVIERVPPEYPESAQESGIGGLVLARALVGEDGRVREVRFVESVRSLDEAVAAALAEWRFEAASSAGKPVAVWIEVPFRFKPN